MENLKIKKDTITWERTKLRNGSVIKYKSQILNHGNHISISKAMYWDGKFKNVEITHIPIELIDNIKSLEPV